jgi:hypothetical protein
MFEFILLDPETAKWLRKMALDTGAEPAILLASMIRDIRIDDELAEPKIQEAACQEVKRAPVSPNLRLVVNNGP